MYCAGAYCVVVGCDVMFCGLPCYAVISLSVTCFDVLRCAVMHRVSSVMWYCVVRFADMSHEE